MIHYIRMKLAEWKLRKLLYEELEDMLLLIKQFSASLKDVPAGKLRDEFLSKSSGTENP